MKRSIIIALSVIMLLTAGCVKNTVPVGPDADRSGHTKATTETAKMNRELLDILPFHNRQDFEDAERGLVARVQDLKVKGEKGDLIWNQTEYGFIKGDAPDSVNPSLWRQETLNSIHGLFKVTDGVYQIRGYDFANMSIIEGKTGWIIVDPLTAKETAAAAIEMARTHLGNKPIRAIIYTHSHIDHFGGVTGIISAEEAKKQGVRIIAPLEFMEEATSENVVAGMAMGRRSMYQYGKNLARSLRGHVGCGLGKGPAYGRFTIIEPTETVGKTGTEMDIDGVRFVFQYTPESEAPAEILFYLPALKALCGAEVLSCNMHNLYTLRGAKVRNALKWSNHINDTIDLFHDAETYFGCHHWPKWGNKQIVEFLKVQRDTYKYIHDQTVRMFNAGYTPGEIAEEIKLPESLQKTFNNRGYYGTLKHNARAVYQAYLGWYDGNPANLDPLPPVESGKLYVETMGGADEVLKKAQAFFDKGNYRFAAQLLNHLVFSDSGNTKARQLLAQTYDQLGYQAESGPWRNVYLSGANELRHGGPEKGISLSSVKDILMETNLSLFFDSMSVRLNGPKAEGKDITVKMTFKDLNESYELKLENSVLHHRKVTADSPSDAAIILTHDLFIDIVAGDAGIKDTLFSDKLSVEGSKMSLVKFFMLFDKPDGTFNIVTP